MEGSRSAFFHVIWTPIGARSTQRGALGRSPRSFSFHGSLRFAAELKALGVYVLMPATQSFLLTIVVIQLCFGVSARMNGAYTLVDIVIPTPAAVRGGATCTSPSSTRAPSRQKVHHLYP
jgi:hypothetical protein